MEFPKEKLRKGWWWPESAGAPKAADKWPTQVSLRITVGHVFGHGTWQLSCVGQIEFHWVRNGLSKISVTVFRI